MAGDNSPSREAILANEDAFIRGVLQAAEDIKSRTRVIKIIRDGQERFQFYVRGLTDLEMDEASRKYAKFERNRGGILVPDVSKAEMALMRSVEIYLATVDEDRARLWDNPTLQEAILGTHSGDMDKVRRGATMVDKLLYGEEKDTTIEAIEKMATTEVADLAKN